MILVSVICWLTLSSSPLVDGYGTGAPRTTCPSLTPRHPGGQLQTSSPPYQVLPSAGQGRIRLVLGSPQGNAYQGFMILARDVETGEFVGEFTNLPESAQHVECTDGLKNAVTHVDKREKHNLEFEWEAPADYEGIIIFNSTFAQDYATYWVGIESPRITVIKRSIDIQTTPATFTTQRLTTPPYYKNILQMKDSDKDASFYAGCASSKNCFGSPDGCVERQNCAAVVSVLVEGERYIFELQATEDAKYVAVGLSEDSKMGDDSVVECVDNGGDKITLHTSWNIGRTNTRVRMPEGTVSLIKASRKDGYLTCKFSRDKLTSVRGHKFDLVQKPYHLLIAAGSSLKNQTVGFHDLGFLGSGEKAMLSDVRAVKAASDVLIRVHGALMLASWIGTASIGMLLARYYRQTWVRSKICGKDHWFAWHRLFMLLTWAMTLGGSIVIVVELGAWSSATYHASLGLATSVLCFVQPFMAAMRPHPGASKRLLFNWVHWFVGNVAHICAILAIFFAVRLPKAQLAEWVDWILVGYVAFHVFVHFFLTFAGCAADKRSSQRVNSIPLQEKLGRPTLTYNDPPKRDAPLAGLRKFIFLVYFLVVVALATAMVLTVALAPIGESFSMLAEIVSPSGQQIQAQQ